VILQWPVREGLLRYAHLLRERARKDYELAVLVWAPQAPYTKGDVKPPPLPKILRGDSIVTRTENNG
jgi:hypothetical protein